MVDVEGTRMLIAVVVAILIAYALRDAVALAGWPPRVSLLANVLVIVLLFLLYFGPLGRAAWS